MNFLCFDKETLQAIDTIADILLEKDEQDIKTVINYLQKNNDFADLFISYMSNTTKKNKQAMDVIISYQYNEMRKHLEDCYRLEIK